jgi:O-antigen ligase
MVLLLLGPASNLVLRGGTGYCFFLLLALAVYMAVIYRRVPAYFTPLRDYGWYTVGMLAFVMAIALQQLVMGYWQPRQLDATSRFALALLIFLMLRQMPSSALRFVGWGCAMGALGAAALAVINHPPGGWNNIVRLNNYYTNAIPFGDMALLLAFLSATTLGLDRPGDRVALAAKLLALAAGSLASYLSGTRGGWLAIPAFMILVCVQYRWLSRRKHMLAAALAVVVLLGALLATHGIQGRLAEVHTDFTLLRHGETDTPTGIRLELWKASWRLFASHPVYGIGEEHLTGALAQMAARGEVGPWIVNARAHSDFFSTLAELGAVGVGCLFLLYWGMWIYFWRNRHADDRIVRAAAYSGLVASAGTVVFGLTIDVLVPIMETALLALLTASFLALIDARKRELTGSGQSAACGRSTVSVGSRS